ncbi:MAG: acetyl-CoA C-acyltransferase, partial [Candidatus Eremiobacteraeota bacterium]|nr:acetyl-CoA C-acyltransferase [Candidatus Eremiobacteraeota bacterium]
MQSNAVILGTARTPFGRLGGALSSIPATSLGAAALAGAIERAGVDPADIEHVIMGQVLQAGVGQAPARQASFKAGLAKTTTSETVNKVCASGLLAVVNAARLINDGSNSVVAAGGMESMSNAPYLLDQARSGYRFGDGRLIDEMIYDGLWDYYFEMTMAAQGAKVAHEFEISREDQDEFAYTSHRLASMAYESGQMKDEVLPLKVASKLKG